ncbi:MAG: UDP-2,4-diacetamido-2,4,6-trideoxy-beta-L-altropyranose hydrolase [Cellvibrionales bacterium UBA7375]|nr:MAG: UDP-2,4-diacetamido-2,4,6-trideoxy-beta-L-altropyranose hydrolase [Cellvibrionales bacterium UBA7375]
MNIYFRVDASLNVGSGHVMRCLALADALQQADSQVNFIVREHKGHMIATIEAAGFSVKKLPVTSIVNHSDILGVSWQQDAAETIGALENKMPDWLIVDHYGIDQSWHQALRTSVKNIFVIDDVPEKPIDCDLLLNQNLGYTDEDYNQLVSQDTQLILGPKYALLRSEFSNTRPEALKKRKKYNGTNNILISLGALDINNLTESILDHLATITWPKPPQVNIVLGEHAPHFESLKSKIKTYPLQLQLYKNSSNISELMLNADIAIGGAGSTAWERCCLGLPSLCFTLADNQRAIAVELDRRKAAADLGKYEPQMIKVFLNLFNALLSDKNKWFEMSNKAFTITTGQGTNLVTNRLLSVSA